MVCTRSKVSRFEGGFIDFFTNVLICHVKKLCHAMPGGRVCVCVCMCKNLIFNYLPSTICHSEENLKLVN